MLRRFRFGFLSLFAAMLLMVSGAGWWKFHRDLYLEEQAVFAQLGKADCDYAVWYELHQPSSPGGPVVERFEPTEWQKLFTRIRVLSVDGDPSEALRARMAALPGLQVLIIERRMTDDFSFNPKPRPPLKPLPAISEILNVPVPAFAEPAIGDADLDRPLDDGEPLSDEEQSATLAAIREAWTLQREAPENYVRMFESEALGWQAQRTVYATARHGDAFLAFSDSGEYGFSSEPFRLSDGSTTYLLDRTPRGLTLAQRYTDSVSENAKPSPADDRFLAPPVIAFEGLLPEDLEHVDVIDRLDEQRIRLVFEPFDRERKPYPQFGWTESVSASQAILREDLGWAVESIRETSKNLVTPSNPPMQIARETRYVRVADRVLPSETLTRTHSEGSVPFVGRTRSAWSLDPQFPEGTFDVNRLLAEPVPPPRDLPLWRWYYGTLGLGVALALFLMGRNAIRFLASRRKAAENAADEVAEPAQT